MGCLALRFKLNHVIYGRNFSCFYISLWWTWKYLWRNCSSQDYWTLVNYCGYNLQNITNGEKMFFFLQPMWSTTPHQGLIKPTHQAVINYVHLDYCKLMCLMQTTTEGTISATTFGKTIPVQDLDWHSSVAENSSLLRCGTMSGVLADRVPRRSESSLFLCSIHG